MVANRRACQAKILDIGFLFCYDTYRCKKKEDVHSMEKYVNQGLLYDFYGELLTAHQKNIYEDVILNDYSISEVAKDAGVSRQSISDLIKRCDKLLWGYEDKLGLVEKFKKTNELVAQIHNLSQTFLQSKDESLILEIERLTAQIKDM